MRKIKLIPLLLAISMLAMLFAGCANDTPKDNDVSTIIPNTDSPSPNDSITPDDETSKIPNGTDNCVKDDENELNPPVGGETELGGITFSFAEFDEKYLDYEETFFTQFSIICFPSDIELSDAIIEEFNTADEFREYLNYYSLCNHSKDTIEMSEKEFVYVHRMRMCSSSGYDNRFFFISHPDFDPQFMFDADESYYDEETKTMYFVLTESDNDRYVDAEYGDVAQNIRDKSTGAHAIMYFHLDEEYEVENIVIVLPR